MPTHGQMPIRYRRERRTLEPGLPCGSNGQTDRSVADRRGRDPLADRARSDGRRVCAGIPAPGPALRRRPRVQRDGVVVRALVRQRAHARLPADRPRRASAGRPDLRLGAGADGRGRWDGGRCRRGHRRHQLRLPGAQGHQDRRRCQRARGPRPRLAGRRSGGRGGRRAGHRQDAPWAEERLARRARPRAAAGGSGRRRADTPPPLGPADVHRLRGPHADGRAGRAGVRARDRLRRHRRPGDGRAGARRHRRRRGDGRPRRAGPAVGAARDGRRRQRRRRARRGGRRARPVHARGGARDGRRARGRIPPQVLRLVPARRRRRPGAARPADAGAERRAAEAILLEACPEAVPLLARAEAEMALLPDSDSDRLLDLPISIYGGG